MSELKQGELEGLAGLGGEEEDSAWAARGGEGFSDKKWWATSDDVWEEKQTRSMSHSTVIKSFSWEKSDEIVLRPDRT